MIWRNYCAAATSFLLLRGESIPDLNYVTYRMEVVYSPLMQLFLGHGCFTHKVPEFILHKAAGSQNRMKVLLFQKNRCQKRNRWWERYKGWKSDKRGELYKSEMDSAWSDKQWDVTGRCSKQEFPILPWQCLTKCWLMTAANNRQLQQTL